MELLGDEPDGLRYLLNGNCDVLALAPVVGDSTKYSISETDADDLEDDE